MVEIRMSDYRRIMEQWKDWRIEEGKQELTEGIDLQSHVVLVKSQLDRFKKDLNDKRGGSFSSDSVEYEQDRWKNNSKMLKARDKKLGQWEKKVNKALNGLIKDYVKAWKV